MSVRDVCAFVDWLCRRFEKLKEEMSPRLFGNDEVTVCIEMWDLNSYLGMHFEVVLLRVK